MFLKGRDCVFQTSVHGLMIFMIGWPRLLDLGAQTENTTQPPAPSTSISTAGTEVLGAKEVIRKEELQLRRKLSHGSQV